MLPASWFGDLPSDHIKIGISRGVPRRMAAGYRLYRKLQPGPWFNSCASAAEFERLYQSEVLDPLDAGQVHDEIIKLAAGRVPVLCCYERPNTGTWCHRALASLWLEKTLGLVVPEFGLENWPAGDHPLMSPELRRCGPD